ncbi:hypothetical protein ACHAPE_001802 [Trichoderma viride]
MDYEITDDYDLYLRAWKAYNKLESEMTPPQYKDAIHACLDARIFRELENNDEKMHSEVFRCIIKPLDEIMFEKFDDCDRNTLDDGTAEDYDLARGLSLPLPTLSSTKMRSLKECKTDYHNLIPTDNHDNVTVGCTSNSKRLSPAGGTVAGTQKRIDKGSNNNSTTQAEKVMAKR